MQIGHPGVDDTPSEPRALVADRMGELGWLMTLVWVVLDVDHMGRSLVVIGVATAMRIAVAAWWSKRVAER